MPSPIEQLALKDAFKHPKLMIIYLACMGLGWLADRLVPNEDQRDAKRWRDAFYEERAARIASDHSKDELYNELLFKNGIIDKQNETIKMVDSLVTPLGHKGKQILKHSSHEH